MAMFVTRKGNWLHLQSDGTWMENVDHIRVELNYENAYTGQREYCKLWEKITPATPIAGLNGVQLNGREENAVLQFTYFTDSGQWSEEQSLPLPTVRLWVRYSVKPWGTLLRKEWTRISVETNCPVRCSENLWIRSENRIQQLTNFKNDKEEYYLPWSGAPVELFSADGRIKVEKI